MGFGTILWSYPNCKNFKTQEETSHYKTNKSEKSQLTAEKRKTRKKQLKKNNSITERSDSYVSQ